MTDTTKNIIKQSLLFALLFEFITILFRFGFGLQSTRDTASTVGKLTGGIRIHHGYVGVLLILISLKKRDLPFFKKVLIFGLALFFSDLIHHFLVLYPLTGNPEFHLVYPKE